MSEPVRLAPWPMVTWLSTIGTFTATAAETVVESLFEIVSDVPKASTSPSTPEVVPTPTWPAADSTTPGATDAPMRTSSTFTAIDAATSVWLLFCELLLVFPWAFEFESPRAESIDDELPDSFWPDREFR